MNEKITGVILAGGAGKRFDGIAKSKILIGGKQIISRILDVMSGIFAEIIIITNTPAQYVEFRTYKIAGDKMPGKGPLSGIHAALAESSNDAIFVVAGDMPFLDKDLIIRQIEFFNEFHPDVLIPQIGHYIEPLHGIYKKLNIKILEEYLLNGNDFSVRGFLRKTDLQFIQFENSEITARAFTNVNTAQDIKRLNNLPDSYF